ncbi:MAG: hypothetical protein LAT66_00205 [Alkalimonas sp.]|nr:hypothetical protein [Alkalimonas sp.]
MPTALELISQQASILQQEGKTASLALLRSRLGKQLHPAELLQAFQQWKQLPESQRLAAPAELNMAAPAETDTHTVSAAERIEHLEQKVQQLETLVEALQQRLDALHVGG